MDMNTGQIIQYSILIFGIILYLNFFCETYSVKETFEQYQSKDLMRSLSFLTIILVLELITEISVMASRCSNIAGGIIYPVLIWIFIFLGTKIMLISVPGFKSAFSDTIGYWFTYGFKQSSFLVKLLKTSDDSKNNLITKIISDKGLLFNSMVPGNFDQIWNSLEPIANPEMYKNPDMEQVLLNMVVQRDHIGEACWMIWSGILCISIISLYTYSFPCELTAAQIRENKANYDKQINDDLAKPTYNLMY